MEPLCSITWARGSRPRTQRRKPSGSPSNGSGRCSSRRLARAASTRASRSLADACRIRAPAGGSTRRASPTRNAYARSTRSTTAWRPRASSLRQSMSTLSQELLTSPLSTPASTAVSTSSTTGGSCAASTIQGRRAATPSNVRRRKAPQSSVAASPGVGDEPRLCTRSSRKRLLCASAAKKRVASSRSAGPSSRAFTAPSTSGASRDHHKDRAFFDARPLLHADLAHASRTRSLDWNFHLHGLQDDQHVALLHRVAYALLDFPNAAGDLRLDLGRHGLLPPLRVSGHAGAA